jgi:hypothetical protein
MRVDFESQITEKDKDDGYFLFEFPDRGKNYAGSMELIVSRKDDVESVRVVLTIQALPSYVESMLMDRLARKLVQEFGAPPERKVEKKPAPSEEKPAEDGDSPPVDEKPKGPVKKGEAARPEREREGD